MAKEIEGEGAEADTNAMAGDHEKHKLSKRIRKEISSSSSSSPEVCNLSLNDLQVPLIEEILCRLPNAQSVFQCKPVCKNWYSLISSPYFARRYITHHFNRLYNQNPCAIIIEYWRQSIEYRLFTVFVDPLFKSPGFELNCLRNEWGSCKVVAVYKDLMLCSINRMDGILRYRICNPFTMQWVILPLLKSHEVLRITDVGFVCEPYYFEDSQGECTVNCDYRFRVVLINEGIEHFILWTYCSETQKWNRSVLKGKEYQLSRYSVAYNGKMLGYNGRNIFEYDPFNPELSIFIDCSYIHSTKLFSSYGHYRLGVCQGSLRMMQCIHSGIRLSLAVWELKDYGKMQWCLEEKVYLDPDTLDQDIVIGRSSLKPLCFHPTDRDIVYLVLNSFVLCCNMRKRELKLAREAPFDYVMPGHVFHVELPLWPTPIPKLTEVPPTLRRA